MASYGGVIKARIVEVKFALSGKVASVHKFTGDTVAKWELLASLDRKSLQAELDRQLSDFEKVRVDFEGFAKRFPDPGDENKYTKAEKQAALNASVKDVELSKSKLDQVDLFSPVAGVILDDSGLVVGINVTPSGSPIKIIDNSSFYFEFGVEQKDIQKFLAPTDGKIVIDGFEKELRGTTTKVIGYGKSFFIRIPITDSDGLVIGLNGKVNF